ncbi:c-type cytochrome [Aquabacterium sp. A7-Y]|uniref:c-type cytochrome n=1 Tax=Aquabacterium sp. A7-Y TaxID=1349605 RepID=UPI00223CF2E6|nr:c-type cytochrome [Aquabacterium sp. A7-Y]MCW7538614.1 c-type cytochrome [Aquabacterium sp. A7-Y]
MRPATARPTRKIALVLLLALGAVAITTGAALLGGWYDVAATSSHTRPVYRLLETAMRYSVQARARDIPVPPLDDATLLARGAACYREHCLQCHGGPGVAPGPIGLSLQPLPGPLVDAARRWRPRELYWITRHGIKMSGMPAWQYRMDERELWSVVAFLNALPGLSPADYAGTMTSAAAQQCPAPQAAAPAHADTRADAAVLFRQYACIGCHAIPGVVGPDTQVGPPLDGLAQRSLLAGRLPNTTENLAQWIRFPRRIDPQTAMPELGVSEAHAQQMAAYLQRLK